ncbi:MAG TPA: zinc ribbon domain-containing protein [Candidatus Limnocylindrales bacterium]
MPNVLQGITDAIGGIVASPLVQLGMRAIAIYWVIFWLAASYWAFRDLQLRTDNAVLPYLAAAFIIVFTPILFPAAIVIYRIVRPHEKIDEVYERTLAQEAMLAEIEAVPTCPRCQRRVQEGWLACPICRTRLSRACPSCDRLVGLDWVLCAWCGRDLERQPAAAPGRASIPAESRRQASERQAAERSAERSTDASGGQYGGGLDHGSVDRPLADTRGLAPAAMPLPIAIPMSDGAASSAMPPRANRRPTPRPAPDR